jgi:hypothetical protein
MKRTPASLLLILFVASAAVNAQSLSSNLTEKQLARAEYLTTKLENLQAFAETNPSPQQYQARTRQLTAAVYKSVSNLPEGNTKTDIATAALFFERYATAWNAPDASDYDEAFKSKTPWCSHEKPGAYQRLCQQTLGSRAALLLLKARLHLSWARSSIAFHRNRGEKDAILRELEFERRFDHLLAERATFILSQLESEVVVHPSLSDLQENGALTRVPYETFRDDLRKAAAEVAGILFWLPQNRLKFEISNALNSYQDGDLWWRSVYRSKVVSVSDFVPSGTSTPSAQAFKPALPYTVAINLRQASTYLRRAEALMNDGPNGEGSPAKLEQ